MIPKSLSFNSSFRQKPTYANDRVDRANETPIDRFVSDLKLAGSGIRKANCPLHEEDTASFVVYDNTNSFYCWGCGEGGDVIQLVQRMHNLGFKEAVDFILYQK